MSETALKMMNRYAISETINFIRVVFYVELRQVICHSVVSVIKNSDFQLFTHISLKMCKALLYIETKEFTLSLNKTQLTECCFSE